MKKRTKAREIPAEPIMAPAVVTEPPDVKQVSGGTVTRKNLHELFQYWGSPVVEKVTTNGSTEQYEQYQATRKSAYEFANAILAQVPAGQSQQTALQLIRGAVYLAAVGIAGEETKIKKTEREGR